MFVNERSGQKQAQLRGYKTESEEDAKARLEAAGWKFSGVDYDWDETAKLFTLVEKGSHPNGAPKDGAMDGETNVKE